MCTIPRFFTPFSFVADIVELYLYPLRPFDFYILGNTEPLPLRPESFLKEIARLLLLFSVFV